MKDFQNGQWVAKNKVEAILSIYVIMVVVAALMFMSVEFVKTFFGLSWDSSVSWGAKVLLVLGWVLFPAIHLFLSKTLGAFVFLPVVRDVSTPAFWRVIKSTSKSLPNEAFKKL